MLTSTPNSIAAYASCPKRCQFSWNESKTNSTNHNIVQDIIKSLYLYHLRRERISPWKNVVGWTERKLVSLLTDITPEIQYKETKGYLLKVSNWYRSDYLDKYADPGLINVPISLGLGRRFTLNDTIDIVTIGNQIKLFDFYELRDKNSLSAYTGAKVYNDLAVQVRIWAFWKASEIIPNEYVRILIGQHKIRSVSVRITDNSLKKAEAVLKQIVRGIQNNVFYPSTSEQCQTCPYKPQCHF